MTKKTYGGYIWYVDEPVRAELLSLYIERNANFSDAFSSSDWNPKTVELFLISLDGQTLTAAALARRRPRNLRLTGKVAIDFSHFVTLHRTSLTDLEKAIGSRFAKYMTRSSSGVGNRIPPETWHSLYELTKSRNELKRAQLEELERLRDEGRVPRVDAVYGQLALEKDAVGLAMEIFGAKRKGVLDHWSPTSIDGASFIQALDNRGLLEDRMIEEDTRVFGLSSRHDVRGGLRLEMGNRQLRVFNLNRERLETTLGADLLYYHHGFNSFVLVQYKRMEHCSVAEGGWRYYPSTDRHFEKQLNLMLGHSRELAATRRSPASQVEWRLCDEAFFFKFCDRITFEELSADLIPGMYVPVDKLEHFLASRECKTENDAIAIGYKNLKRYLTNSQFGNLVQEGWIGCDRIQSKQVGRWIEDALEGRRAVTIARSSKR